MAFEIPLSLGGPVLHWELIRSTRRVWPYVLRYGYAAWLFVQFMVMLSGFAATLNAAQKTPDQLMPGDPLYSSRETPGEKFVRFSGDYLSIFLQQQILLLILVAPAVTAGALGHEKERGTLQALFGTELQSIEIVLGKLLGRLTILGQLALIGMPLYFLMGGFAGLGFGRLVLGLIQGYLVGFAFAAAAMLASVWTRQTRDAILACYAMVTVVILGTLLLLGDLPLPSWVNPLEVCQREFSPPFPDVRPAALFLHFLVWGGSGLACVGLSIWRLRHACLIQLEGVGRTPLKLLWLFRPPLRGNPVRWRETHIIGLAPLPWLRMVPKWMAMLGVLAFSTILMLSAMSGILGQGFFPALRTLDFAMLRSEFAGYEPTRVYQELVVMGVILLFLGPLVVAVRCAGSISEEKRRKTWEDLVVTPLTFDEIVQGKMWGVLAATTPYLIMYALPMLGLSLMVGIGGVSVTLVFVSGTWFAMFLAASLGMAYSAGELQTRTKDQSLIHYLRQANAPAQAHTEGTVN
jgi:ABC-type transport system involved in multi-copper enzyme maturation permease subunit